MSGVAPDPLDRLLSFAEYLDADAYELQAGNDIRALVEIARAARDTEYALRVTAPKASQPWLRKLVTLKNLRASLALLDKDAVND